MWSLILSVFIAVAGAEEFIIRTTNLTGPLGSRIIGGVATTIENYPYTVQILLNNQLTCAGSLVTKRHVLSAAHCFVNDNGVTHNPNLFRVRVGSTYLSSGGTIHAVSTVIVHEQYDTPVRDNDIAVLVLATTVTLGQSVDVAYLPLQNAVVPDNATVVHVGWGRTHVAIPQASEVLNEVTIRKVNREVCQLHYTYLQTVTGQPYVVTNNMICAGLLGVGGKDACQGDSGGPLIYNGVVVGVTSWGYGCAEAYFPGVSARVASYTNWINNTVTRYNSGSRSAVSTILLFTPVLLMADLRR